MFSIKKKFKKKKALQVVTWDDSDEEDQGEAGHERGAQQDQADLDSQPQRDHPGGVRCVLQELDQRLGGPPRRQALLR